MPKTGQMRSHIIPSYASDGHELCRNCRDRFCERSKVGTEIRQILKGAHSAMSVLDILWHLFGVHRHHCHQFPADRPALHGLRNGSSHCHCVPAGAVDSALLHSQSQVLGTRFDGGQRIYGHRFGHHILLFGHGLAAGQRTANGCIDLHVAGLLFDYDLCDGSNWRRYAVGELHENTAEFRGHLRRSEQGHVRCHDGVHFVGILGLLAVRHRYTRKYYIEFAAG